MGREGRTRGAGHISFADSSGGQRSVLRGVLELGMLCPMLRLAVASLLLLGCYDAYEVGDPLVSSDAAVRDAAPVPGDATPLPRDASPSPRDAFAPPPPPRDAGMPVCREGTPSVYDGPRCARSTQACLEGCEDGAFDEEECVNDCVRAEPACVECLIGEIVECSVPASGCQAAWDEFACCRATECRGLELIDCFNGPCFDATDRMFACFDSSIDRCAEAQGLCFF